MDNTLLMFVGEDLSVVTVASRYPETPSSAPAIVTVVNRQRIDAWGYKTLGELLSFEAGFYMAERASGTLPFLRGIPDGILFFYDGVPMPSGASGSTRSISPLDLELSLDNVKQVEIVRGPGSVLWGADAFAGIVNIVPMNDRDAKSFRVKASLGSNELKTGYLSFAETGKKWRSFVSAQITERLFHEDNYNVYTYTGTDSNGSNTFSAREDFVDPSRSFEISANAQFDDWLHFSARFSDFVSKYSVEDINGLRWKGERSTPVSSFSVKGTRIVGDSHWTVSSYYQNVSYELKNVDVISKEENDIFFGELLWDKRFFDRGLITAGVSSRIRLTTGAQTEAGFLPDYMIQDITFHVPQDISEQDYNSRLTSFFAQYRHRLNTVEVWTGVRYDDSSEFDANISTSLGLNWQASDAWRVKTVFGTGYRNPYSEQVYGDAGVENDGIKTINLQVEWTPFPKFRLAATGFYSVLSNYIKPDSYAGTSEPVDQNIFGFEIEGNARLTDKWDAYLNLTKTFFNGDDYHFKVYKWSYVDPDDNTIVSYYDEWDEPFDGGADFLINAGLVFHVNSRTDWAINVGGRSSVPYFYTNKDNTLSGSYSAYGLVNTAVTIEDFGFDHTRFQAGVKNLLNCDYQVPGYFGVVEGRPRTFFVEWTYLFD